MIIDNFFEDSIFKKISQSFDSLDIKSEVSFDTSLEKNKDAYSLNSMNLDVNGIIKNLVSSDYLVNLGDLIGIENLVPLTNLKNNNLKFYHVMGDGGFLGSHVDHSQAVDGDLVHCLNCIYYASPHWETNFGGNTVFFDKYGFRKVSEVQYKPNRLLIFLHTSNSFHGVTKITSKGHSRYSVYMDYYASIKDLNRVRKKSELQNTFLPKFWKHNTTFFPSKFQDIGTYLPGYIKYFFGKFFKKFV